MADGADTKEEEIFMVAGHLREKNGIYQMILSYKDVNGKRKTKSVSTGLKIRGNARNADRMLQQLRQTFTAPDMHPDYRKDVETNELPVDVSFNSKITASTNGLSQSASKKSLKQIEISDDIPLIDSNILLRRKEEILFCDFMVYWLESVRYIVEEDTFSCYAYTIKNRIYPYFKKRSLR